MTTQKSNPQAIFPNIPRESPAVDKEGNFTALWSLALGQLFQTLQQNFKNEGIVFPPLNATQIAQIEAIYAPYVTGTLPLPPGVPDISGQTVFDSTNRVPKQFIITYDGSTPPNVLTASWKTFTLT